MFNLLMGAVAGLVIGGTLGIVIDRLLLTIKSSGHARARKRGETTPTNLVPMGLWKSFSIIGAIIGFAIMN